MELLLAALYVSQITTAPKPAIFNLVALNLPLIYFWAQSMRYRGNDDFSSAYHYNTMFMRWYSARLIINTIFGFVLLLLATQQDSAVDYFCKRYYLDGEADPTFDQDLVGLTSE